MRGTARVSLRTGAFTLVELLVVMGIISLLVALLLPAVNQAVVVARSGATKTTIQACASGLEAFKRDWGIYPPSSDKPGRDGPAGKKGYQNLAYYLMGPSAKGWGIPADKKGPFGMSATLTYGPYFMQEAGADVTRGIPDAFRRVPLTPILYYRFEPNEKMSGTYVPTGGGLVDYQDNVPLSEHGFKGFYSEAQLMCSVTHQTPDGKYRWRRDDYFLISAGPDGLFGWYFMNTEPPTPVTSLQDVFQRPEKLPVNDDITNMR